MTVRTRTFTTADHDALDTTRLKLTEDVRDGVLRPDGAAEDLGHLFAAVDVGNTPEPLARADHPAEVIAHMANRRQRANAR